MWISFLLQKGSRQHVTVRSDAAHNILSAYVPIRAPAITKWCELHKIRNNRACASKKSAIMAGASAPRRAICVGIGMVLAKLLLIII